MQHAEEVQKHEHAQRDAKQPKQKIAGHFVLSPSESVRHYKRAWPWLCSRIAHGRSTSAR
jgi:hypothetical protein